MFLLIIGAPMLTNGRHTKKHHAEKHHESSVNNEEDTALPKASHSVEDDDDEDEDEDVDPPRHAHRKSKITEEDSDEPKTVRGRGEVTEEDIYPSSDPMNNFINRKRTSDMYWVQIRSKDSLEKMVHACQNNALIRFKRNLTIIQENFDVDDDVKCINCLVQNYQNLMDFKCPEDFTIPVRKYLNRSEKTDTVVKKRAITSDVSYMRNKGSQLQTARTAAQTYTVTDTTDFSMMGGLRLSSKATVGIPMVTQADFTVELSSTFTDKRVHTLTKTVTANAQDVKLPPHSWIKTGWVLYETKRIYNYTVDLEIDDTQPNENSERFKEFHELREEDGYPIFHNKKRGVYLHYRDGKTILHNVPVYETLTGYSINVEFEEEKSLDVPMPADAVVNDL